MFSFFTNKLTQSTGNLIDFSRAGNFLRAGNHRYTAEEIALRSIVVISTAMGGLIAYNLNSQSEDPTLSNASAAILGSMIGMIMGHIPVAYNIIHKRSEMKEKAQHLVDEINKEAKKLNLSSLTDEVIHKIFACTLADSKNSHASQTLGRRIAILTTLKEIFKNESDPDQIKLILSLLLKDFNVKSIFKKEIQLEDLIKQDNSSLSLRKGSA